VTGETSWVKKQSTKVEGKRTLTDEKEEKRKKREPEKPKVGRTFDTTTKKAGKTE